MIHLKRSDEAPRGPWRRAAALWRRLTRPTTVHRLLVLSPVFVFAATAAAAALALELRAGAPDVAGWQVALGAGLCATLAIAPVFRLGIRRSLAQVAALERTAERIERGELDARAPFASPADADAVRLTRVFNRLMDGMLADRQKLRDVAARAFRAQEAERERLAKELQDQTAQTLSALLIRLRIARASADPATRDALLDDVRRELAETADHVRSYARFLHTPVLDELGVVAAVRTYARILGGSTGVKIEVDAAEVRGALTADGELALYRTVQEALANAVRHADAESIRVTIGVASGAVEAVVEDDGVGFRRERLEAEGPCLGLFGMQERALYAGGTAEVESEPGRGTRVRIRIPLREPDPARPRWPAIVTRPLPAALQRPA